MDFFWTGRNNTRTHLSPQREIYHTQFFIFCFKSNCINAIKTASLSMKRNRPEKRVIFRPS
ncbi:hypothetical protein F9817_04760 [Vibrio sp. CAIM 722]|uniref:Uncharacterized protein n=1 Tax=Vibrio eleionomae TaxID=2653505 RepID=A0A7X4RTR5_9VIBR|nr:hypothetical protein [Vibrio eleionomae]